MRNSKRVVVAGLACVPLAAFAVSVSRAQDDRNDAMTEKIRIVTVERNTNLSALDIDYFVV